MNDDIRILIIEDDPLFQAVLQTGLTQHNIQADLAQDGGAARMRLEANPDAYDLVLLDMQLPDASGLEILQMIRGYADQNRLPVIIYSGNEQDHLVIEGLEKGANDYVFKSAELPILLARIRSHLTASDAYEASLNETQVSVMQESLGAACHYIAQPMTAATTAIEMLVEEEDSEGPLAEKLKELNKWIKASGQEIHRLQNIKLYNTMDYANGIRIIDADEPVNRR